ncbi:ADP-ribosyltransferase [Actinomadura sp. NPDC000600]|uniref:ADP-ribosyltransferase n=1 Tax=Actinomadura sp. NPDC000600 TaxID=3154262 RepID=UPI003397F483
MRDLASRVPADPNRFIVDGHGDADGMRVGGRRLSVDDVADLIRNDPNWDGREVMLLSCETGDGQFATQLAQRLGVPVTAPHGLAWSDADGNVYASSGRPGEDGRTRPDLPPNGGWQTHRPDGGTAPAGRDGYAPGHPVSDAESAAVRPGAGDATRGSPTQDPWNPPQVNRADTQNHSLNPKQHAADVDYPKREGRHRILAVDKDGHPVLDENGRQIVRSIVYTNADGRVTHITNPQAEGEPGALRNPNENIDLTRPRPGVVHQIDFGQGDPHVFVGTDDNVSPAAAPFDPPTHTADGEPLNEVTETGHDPSSGPYSARQPLAENSRIAVYDNQNRLHGIFWTDGDGNITHVRTWYGDQNGVAHYNGELGLLSHQDDGVPLPNVNYMVEPRTRFSVLDPADFDPIDAVRRGDLGAQHEPDQGVPDPAEPETLDPDHQVPPGTFLFHTDDNGQTDMASGRPDYDAGGGVRYGAQRHVGHMGNDEYPGTRFNGGHIFGHQGQGPRERINYFPQWEVENQGKNAYQVTRPESWYGLEEHLAQLARDTGNNITVDRFEFFAEPNRSTDGDLAYTPQVIHARWSQTDFNEIPPVTTVHYRTFYNLPPNQFGTPPTIPHNSDGTPKGPARPFGWAEPEARSPEPPHPASRSTEPPPQNGTATHGDTPPPIDPAARSAEPTPQDGPERGHGDSDGPAPEHRASDEVMRQVHDDPRVREMLDRAGEPLGEQLRTQLQDALPNHPELARIVAGHGLNDLETSLRESLLERPKTLNSVLSHPEAVRILEGAVHDVNERGADAILGGERAKAQPTPLTPEQEQVSRRLADSVVQARRPGEDAVPHVAPDQPGFDPSRVDPEAGRDDPYINAYLDGLYHAKHESEALLHALVHDPELGEMGADPKLRPGDKDRTRALDKIMGDYVGDASRLNDLLGARIQFRSVDGLYRALGDIERIAGKHGVEIVSVKDRMQSPVPSGYRDVQLTIRMPNGHIGELRLHLRSIDDVASYEHSLYEVRRDLPNVAEAQNRTVTPEELALDEAIKQRVIGRFQEAVDEALHGPPPHSRTAAPHDAASSEPPPHDAPSGDGRAARPETVPRPEVAAKYGWYSEPAPEAPAPSRGTPPESGTDGVRPPHSVDPPHDGNGNDPADRDTADEGTSGKDQDTADTADDPVPADLPEHLHDLYRDSESTPAGRSFFGPDEPAMRDLARRVEPDPDTFVVDGHGDRDGVLVNGRRLSVDDMAALIRTDPNWNGRQVMLLSCRTGEGDFAARLAQQLGVPVVAPRGLAWSDSDGNVFASSGRPGPDGQQRPTWPPDGGWDVHRPDGTVLAGDGGHPPGHPGDAGHREHGGEPQDAEARGLRDWLRPEGRTDPDGVHRFDTDRQGERYGENRLGHVFRNLPDHLRRAAWWYTRQSMPNRFLRPGGPDVGAHLNRLAWSEWSANQLHHLNGGRMPTRLEEIVRLRSRTDLDPHQRQLVDRLLAPPLTSVTARLEQLRADHQERHWLRQYLGEEPTEQAFWRRIAEIDQALNQPLPEPVQAVRGLADLNFLLGRDGLPLSGRDPVANLVGTVQTDGAPMSTSFGRNPAEVDGQSFGNRVHLVLPPGSRGLWMGSSSAFPDQRELILPRGTRYQITSVVHTGFETVTLRDGTVQRRPTYDIEAVVIPPGPPTPRSGS